MGSALCECGLEVSMSGSTISGRGWMECVVVVLSTPLVCVLVPSLRRASVHFSRADAENDDCLLGYKVFVLFL